MTLSDDLMPLYFLLSQVQLSAMDHQSMQRQLHKVLKELRKARDHTAMEAVRTPNSIDYKPIIPWAA